MNKKRQELINIDINKISIKIHPKSYIHSIIKFKDGLIKICAHEPNMSIPITSSLDKNLNHSYSTQINFKTLNNLNFTEVNIKKFPVINISPLRSDASIALFDPEPYELYPRAVKLIILLFVRSIVSKAFAS